MFSIFFSETILFSDNGGREEAENRPVLLFQIKNSGCIIVRIEHIFRLRAERNLLLVDARSAGNVTTV